METVAIEFVTVEVFVLVDADGNYASHEDAGLLLDRFEEEVGEKPTIPTRVLCIQVKVPKPREVVLVGEVKAEPSDEIALAVQ
jgi:hypothetical protein